MALPPVSAGENICLIDPFWPFFLIIRFGEKCFFNRSILAIFGSLFGSPEEAEELLLLRCIFGAGEWGARGAGAPPGGRGASIFLGGGDPFQPEIII
jgi:hypothetical protein